MISQYHNTLIKDFLYKLYDYITKLCKLSIIHTCYILYTSVIPYKENISQIPCNNKLINQQSNAQ